MIKGIWYFVMRRYLRVTLRYYFKRFIIKGRENIPNGAVIFAANHQNAFLDAIIIVSANSHITHFLTRADVFKNSFARWFLGVNNLHPIYRARDGRQALAQNQETFDYSRKALAKGHGIVVFPEGSHGEKRHVRALSKGFTRVAFETIEKHPDLTVNIVPVGLNYTNHSAFRSSASIYFGEPLKANDYLMGDTHAESVRLRTDLSDRLKTLTTHVDDLEHYDEIIEKVEACGVNYLDPHDTNEKIAHWKTLEPISIKKSKLVANTKILMRPVYWIVWLINALPLALWKKANGKIKDPVFIGSIKYCLGIFVFPIFYLAETLVVYVFLGWEITVGFGVFCIFSMWIEKALRPSKEIA